MIPSDPDILFDELLAGRAIGDMSPAELRELAVLEAELGFTPDTALELLAASLELNSLPENLAPLPTALAGRLYQWADSIETPSSRKIIQAQVPAWKIIARNPINGWAAAAAILILSLLLARKDDPQPPESAAIRLRTEAVDLIERKFEGLGNFKQANGKVIWSDQFQKGYMTLSGLPVNDPRQAQYQLWIVDPTRDADAPVDGGVFDIPADGTPAVIPIAAKLALSKPQAFVITLEQPGGVVKSKQEQVVALAKN
jgi:anti-sigma-K factor RskA